MTNIVPLRPVRPHQPHRQMAEARRAFIEAFGAWVRTSPDTADVAEEIEGTMSVLRQLRDLSGGAA